VYTISLSLSLYIYRWMFLLSLLFIDIIIFIYCFLFFHIYRYQIWTLPFISCNFWLPILPRARGYFTTTQKSVVTRIWRQIGMSQSWIRLEKASKQLTPGNESFNMNCIRKELDLVPPFQHTKCALRNASCLPLWWHLGRGREIIFKVCWSLRLLVSNSACSQYPFVG